MGNGLSLVVSIGVPLIGGIIGGITTQKDVLTWYPNIKKPRWTPPNFLFGPVWTVLYISMGTASWFVWRKKGNNRTALALYGAQLVLNLIWNPLFFKTHKTDVALVDITALLGLATAATVSMARTHRPAVQLPLMLPYLAWVSYAAALNANIWAKNPSERLIKRRKQKVEEEQAEADSHKPASAVKEAAAAVTTGVEAAKAGTQAVSAARHGHVPAAVLAADKVPTAGAAAVHHGAEAAKPVVAAAKPVMGAAGAVRSAAGSAKAAIASVGAALGVTSPAQPPPPPPDTLAPASKAMAGEVERAAAAAAAPPGPADAAAGSSRGAAEAIKRELQQAGAL